MSKIKTTTLLSLLLAATFITFGAQKFGAENIVFQTIADRSGISFFEPHIRSLTGLAEIFTAALLIMPLQSFKRAGALIGLSILIGAIGFHLSPWLGINVPTIGHGLFLSSLAMLGLNLGLLFSLFPAKEVSFIAEIA